MKLSAIFSDNMILQANKPVYVFGEGKGKITVEIQGKSVSYVSNNENWLVELPSFDYGGPYVMMVNLDGDIKVFNDIYFGDVYLLSGQSNNQIKLWQTNTPEENYKDNDSIRLFTVDRLENQGKHVLTEDGWKTLSKNGDIINLQGEHYGSKDGWIVAQKDEVGFWPAIGYLLGDILTQKSDRKIGLIACYQGASVIQSWLPKHYLDNTEFFVPLEKRSLNARKPLYSAWNGDGMLYEGMIEKIIPFSFKAVVWYQGESNFNGEDSKCDIYAGILKMLVEKWREDFKDNNLPFIIVQIHDYAYSLNLEGSGWRDIQKAQEVVCETVNDAYLVKSADICETNNIHPPTKLPLAKRIADVVSRF